MKAKQSDISGTGKAGTQNCAPGRGMNRLAKAAVLFVSLAVLGVWSGEAMAIAKFARVAGNWSAVGTWSSVSCAAAGATTVPSAADDVTICNGINVTVDGAGVAGSVTIAPGATATALTLGAAGTLTVTNASGLSGNVIINGSTANRTRSLAVGTRTLTVTGNVTINGGATTGGASNISQLTVTTTPGTANIGGNLIINAGTVNTSSARATVTTGTINVTGDVTLTGGITSNTRDVLLSVTGASAVGAGINIGGNLNINSTLATTSTVSMTSTGRITVNGAVGVNNGDVVTIGSGVFTVSNAAATFANSNAAIVAATSVSTGTLNVAGNLTNAAGDTITATGAGNISVGGNWSNSGTFTAGTSTVTLTGTNSTLGGSAATTFNNLTINKTANNDVTINSASAALSPAVNGVLTLTSGHVFTTVGTNDLGLGTAGTVPGGGSTASHVVGDMQKNFLAGNSSFTFPIGDSINYQPVTIALTGVTTAGALNAHVDSGDHPDTIANISRIDQTNSANHYWTLIPGTLAGGTYTATFQFCVTTTCSVPAERDTLVPSPPATFIVARKNAGAWTRPTVGAITANTIQTTGGVISATGFGEFAVGIPLTGVYKGVNQLIDLREVY